MKKTFFVLFVVTFFSSLCFAQEPLKPIELKTFTGKIESISFVDSVKETPSEIVVVDEKGQKLSFVVTILRPSTRIYTIKDKKMLTLSELKKGDKVIVEYLSGQKGTNRARFVKVAE